MIVRAARFIVPNSRAKPAVPRDVQDGLADLRDYCDNPATHCSTAVAGEAISGVYRLYHLGEADKVRQAYSALHRLRERNGDALGQDIPANHLTVYKGFRDVLDGLIDAIERDWSAELKQQLGGRVR